MARLLTELELDALNRGLARWYRGRLVPIMRGAEETEEEKAAREKAEADALAAKDKVFKQEDVDRIVQERLARDRKDRPSDDEITALREKATKFDELDTANKTELEKERARADKAEADRQGRAGACEQDLDRGGDPDRCVRGEGCQAGASQQADRHERGDRRRRRPGHRSRRGSDQDVPRREPGVRRQRQRRYQRQRQDRSADQGARGGGEQQLTSTEGMSPDEIATAVAEGRLDDYLKSPERK
jgi:hypothetical protein